MQIVTGMAKRCPGHDGEGHHADGSGSPQMQCGSLGQQVRPQQRASHGYETQRNEGIGDVQDRDQWFGEGLFNAPPGQPGDMEQPNQDHQRCGYDEVGSEYPHQKGNHRGKHDELVEIIEWNRQLFGLLFDQPVTGETWNYASADQHHQRQNRGQTKADW